MRKLLMICLMIITISVIKAQAHISTGDYACQLVPKSLGYEKRSCPACKAKRDKEEKAKKAEDKRKSDAVLAKSKATEAAKQTAFKKQQEARDAKNKTTEVKVVMPKTSASAVKTNKVEMDDKAKFRIENEYDESKNKPTKSYHSKIYYDDKLVFESNQFIKINYVYSLPNNKIVFEAAYPLPDTECGNSSYPHYNNKVLLDKDFKKINFEGIDKYWKFDPEEDKFSLSTLPEICEKTKSTTFGSGGYWEFSTKHIIDPETMKISSKSQGLAAIMCNCDE